MLDSVPVLNITFAVFSVLSIILWYVWRYILPYAKFPSYVWATDLLLVLKTVLFKTSNSTKPFPSSIFQTLLKACKKHEAEGMCAIWGFEPFLFIFGEDKVKFFAKEPAALDKPKMYKLFDFFMGKNKMFSGDAKVWKRDVKIYGPVFYPITLQSTLPSINEYGASLVQNLGQMKDGTVEELHELLKVCVARLFYDILLGLKDDSEENEFKIKRITKILVECSEFATYRICSPWLYPDFTLHILPFARRYLKLQKELKVIITGLLEDLIDKVTSSVATKSNGATNSGETRRHSLCDAMIKHHFQDPKFTIEDLYYVITGFTLAAFDTVSHAMKWCLYLLGLDENVQEKAYEEVMSVVPEDDVQFDDLKKLSYIECVIKEALRLYPPAPIFGRRLNKDVQCGKYKVPKDTNIIYFAYLLHRNPEIYPNPEMFIPERFLETDSKIKPWTLIPFAEGLRYCIGKKFAMMQMKILLCHILRNYKVISLDGRENLQLGWSGGFLACYNRLRIQFIPR